MFIIRVRVMVRVRVRVRVRVWVWGRVKGLKKFLILFGVCQGSSQVMPYKRVCVCVCVCVFKRS